MGLFLGDKAWRRHGTWEKDAELRCNDQYVVWPPSPYDVVGEMVLWPSQGVDGNTPAKCIVGQRPSWSVRENAVVLEVCLRIGTILTRQCSWWNTSIKARYPELSGCISHGSSPVRLRRCILSSGIGSAPTAPISNGPQRPKLNRITYKTKVSPTPLPTYGLARHDKLKVPPSCSRNRTVRTQ